MVTLKKNPDLYYSLPLYLSDFMLQNIDSRFVVDAITIYIDFNSRGICLRSKEA